MSAQTITDTQTTTNPDGSTTTTVTYSDGTTSTALAPATGSPAGNLQTLQARAQQALSTNATFQAIASPSNAQNAAQVQALTKQCNGIIRLLLNQLDSITGT